MSCVMIRLVLTIESCNGMPIQIERLVPIQLGRNLDGSPIPSLSAAPGIVNEGVLEVDLVLPPTAAFEFPSPPLQVSISRLAPNGTLATSETALRPQPMSPAYKQLTLLGVKYKSENSDA